MPEGHTIHRLARLHRRALGGRRVAVSSPQGRFAEGAARLDGRVLEETEGHGKHLFYRFGGLAEALHVHLGLVGGFRTRRAPIGAAGPATRVRLAADGVAVDLVGPMVCELLDPEAEERLRARLGPDPLRGEDPAPMWTALQRRRVPVGAALLDQSVVAGIGNVYRAEALFLVGVHPHRPAREVTRPEFEALWRLLRVELKAGERSGRIVTVHPADVGAPSRAQVPDGERLYVYRRGGLPCRRCATPIVDWRLAGRTISACPSCQAH